MFAYGFSWLPIITLSLSLIILLMTGVFVSSFVNAELIKSGLKREKKAIDQTEEEVREEKEVLERMEMELKNIRTEVAQIHADHVAHEEKK